MLAMVLATAPTLTQNLRTGSGAGCRQWEETFGGSTLALGRKDTSIAQRATTANQDDVGDQQIQQAVTPTRTPSGPRCRTPTDPGKCSQGVGDIDDSFILF
jgi:hypothetical protein